MHVGTGANNIRWLTLCVSLSVSKKWFPHQIRVPCDATTKRGRVLRPREVIRNVLKDSEEVVISFMPANGTAEVDPSFFKGWTRDAFGSEGHLCCTEVAWKAKIGGVVSIPKSVCGTFYPTEDHLARYKSVNASLAFDIPLQPVKEDRGDFVWLATLRTPPGVAQFSFVPVDGDGRTILSDSIPCENGQHILSVDCDIPIFRPESGDPNMNDVEEDYNDYSIDFLRDWQFVCLSETVANWTIPLKRIINTHYFDLSLCYSRIALFHPGHERFVFVEDLAYFLGIESVEKFEALCAICEGRRETKISFTKMIESIIHWTDPNEDIFVSNLNDLISRNVRNEDRVYRRKEMIGMENFAKIVKKFRIVYSRLSPLNKTGVINLFESLGKLVSEPDDLTRIILLGNNSEVVISPEAKKTAIALCDSGDFISFLRFLDSFFLAFGPKSFGPIASLLLAKFSL